MPLAPPKDSMHNKPIQVVSRPHSIAGSAAPKPPVMDAAAPEPEVHGLTQDEIRRIVLDIIG
jgi:hypothetical protein